MHLSRLRLIVLASSSCAAFAFACGGISDPTKNGSSEPVATVSGALTGTSVPANARVALVWRTASSSSSDGGYAVGDDVAVVNGKFTMSLAVPASAYFSQIDGRGEFGSSSSGGEPPSINPTEPAPAPADPGSGSSSGSPPPTPGKLPSFNTRLTPRDNVSGGFITAPLSGAVAGFVVYVDTNGNGKLDLSGAYASSTDTILGGNRELVLAYLKDGGALDYEKLRDTSGILPAQGFNLAWTAGKRWMPLNVVQLKLDPKEGLPSPVCSSSGAYSGGGSSGSSPGFDPVATPLPAPDTTPPPSGGSSGGSSSGSGGSSGTGGGSYPSPTDPNLRCAPDGRSFSYSVPSDCPAPAPAPTGLCANNYGDTTIGCAPSAGWGEGLASGQPVPANWPCPVAPDQDGGPAPDSGK